MSHQSNLGNIGESGFISVLMRSRSGLRINCAWVEFSGCQIARDDSYYRSARKGVSDDGPIAQSVEQWIENSRVGGSNPSRATFTTLWFLKVGLPQRLGRSLFFEVIL